MSTVFADIRLPRTVVDALLAEFCVNVAICATTVTSAAVRISQMGLPLLHACGLPIKYGINHCNHTIYGRF
jgi:hypothetical protein